MHTSYMKHVIGVSGMQSGRVLTLVHPTCKWRATFISEFRFLIMPKRKVCSKLHSSLGIKMLVGEHGKFKFLLKHRGVHSQPSLALPYSGTLPEWCRESPKALMEGWNFTQSSSHLLKTSTSLKNNNYLNLVQ